MKPEYYSYYLIRIFFTSAIFAFFSDRFYIVILFIVIYRILDFYLNNYKRDLNDIFFYFSLMFASFAGFITGRYLIKDRHPFRPEKYHEKILFSINKRH